MNSFLEKPLSLEEWKSGMLYGLEDLDKEKLADLFNEGVKAYNEFIPPLGVKLSPIVEIVLLPCIRRIYSLVKETSGKYTVDQFLAKFDVSELVIHINDNVDLLAAVYKKICPVIDEQAEACIFLTQTFKLIIRSKLDLEKK